MLRFAPLSALALAVALAACGDGATDPDDPSGTDPTDPGVTDTTAPTLASSAPAHGAMGVAADTTLTLQFSEPMDTESVEDQLDTTELGAVGLSWNLANDALTITPDLALDVATGPIDGFVEASSYRVIVGDDARDVAGNPLGDTVEVEFRVERELWARIPAVDRLSRTITPSELVFAVEDPLVIGDDADNEGWRATMTFELAGLPGDPSEVVDAFLTTEQLPEERSGAPFDGLGTLTLDHVVFTELDSESAINGAFNASQAATRTYGGIASSHEHVDIEVDVTDAVNADLEGTLGSSQFLLYFDGFTDLDDTIDRAVFSREKLRLEVSYRVP